MQKIMNEDFAAICELNEFRFHKNNRIYKRLSPSIKKLVRTCIRIRGDNSEMYRTALHVPKKQPASSKRKYLDQNSIAD